VRINQRQPPNPNAIGPILSSHSFAKSAARSQFKF